MLMRISTHLNLLKLWSMAGPISAKLGRIRRWDVLAHARKWACLGDGDVRIWYRAVGRRCSSSVRMGWPQRDTCTRRSYVQDVPHRLWLRLRGHGENAYLTFAFEQQRVDKARTGCFGLTHATDK